MLHRIHYSVVGMLTLFALTAGAAKQPNIIVILADDMGMDSVSAFNHSLGFKPPCIDALASEGMVFTDGHSGSAVCTPTRYGLLTGRYSWRSRLKRGRTLNTRSAPAECRKNMGAINHIKQGELCRK